MIIKSYLKSYQNLEAWQEAMNLAENCYRLTSKFPEEEIYGITNQIRRAAISVPASIAEGHGRNTKTEFIKFLYIAQGSLRELETHLLLSTRVELITPDILRTVQFNCKSVGKLLSSLIVAIQGK